MFIYISPGEDGYATYQQWRALQRERRERGMVMASISNIIGHRGSGCHGNDSDSILVGRSLVPAAFRMKTGMTGFRNVLFIDM